LVEEKSESFEPEADFPTNYLPPPPPARAADSQLVIGDASNLFLLKNTLSSAFSCERTPASYMFFIVNIQNLQNGSKLMRKFESDDLLCMLPLK
jgi:hypothetical protein